MLKRLEPLFFNRAVAASELQCSGIVAGVERAVGQLCVYGALLGL